MKRLLKTLLITFILFAALALPAIAQDSPTNTPAPDASIATAVSSAATPFVSAFAAKYTWFATVLIVVGAFRFLMKPIMTIVEIVIALTPSKADDEALQKFESGPIWKWILWVLDWLGSIKTPSSLKAGTSNPVLK